MKVNPSWILLLHVTSFSPLLIDFLFLFSTDVTSRNVGVYYIPHEDTDPEQESKTHNISVDGAKSDDESSDDEWTYKNLENCSDLSVDGNSLNENKATPTAELNNLRDETRKVLDSEKLNPGFIQRLVDQADELVQTTKRVVSRKKCSSTSAAKHRLNEHVREWLRKCQQTGDYSSVSRRRYISCNILDNSMESL